MLSVLSVYPFAQKHAAISMDWLCCVTLLPQHTSFSMTCCFCCRLQWTRACGVWSHTPTRQRLRASKAQNWLWAILMQTHVPSASKTSCKLRIGMMTEMFLRFETVSNNIIDAYGCLLPYLLAEDDSCVNTSTVLLVSDCSSQKAAPWRWWSCCAPLSGKYVCFASCMFLTGSRRVLNRI